MFKDFVKRILPTVIICPYAYTNFAGMCEKSIHKYEYYENRYHQIGAGRGREWKLAVRKREQERRFTVADKAREKIDLAKKLDMKWCLGSNTVWSEGLLFSGLFKFCSFIEVCVGGGIGLSFRLHTNYKALLHSRDSYKLTWKKLWLDLRLLMETTDPRLGGN